MTDSWVTTHDARPFNDRVVHGKAFLYTSKKNYVATISSCRSHGKRRINMSTYGNDWIITFSNSEDTDVFFWRFFGTEEAVKEKLVTLAKEHSTDTESDL